MESACGAAFEQTRRVGGDGIGGSPSYLIDTPEPLYHRAQC